MSKNSLAHMLRQLGVLTIVIGIIISIICGIVFCEVTYEYCLYSEVCGWGIAIIGSVASFVLGVVFFVFSEIISLLQAHVNNQKEILEKINSQTKENVSENPEK